jgi:hypothetical protein
MELPVFNGDSKEHNHEQEHYKREEHRVICVMGAVRDASDLEIISG